MLRSVTAELEVPPEIVAACDRASSSSRTIPCRSYRRRTRPKTTVLSTVRFLSEFTGETLVDLTGEWIVIGRGWDAHGDPGLHLERQTDGVQVFASEAAIVVVRQPAL